MEKVADQSKISKWPKYIKISKLKREKNLQRQPLQRGPHRPPTNNFEALVFIKERLLLLDERSIPAQLDMVGWMRMSSKAVYCCLKSELGTSLFEIAQSLFEIAQSLFALEQTFILGAMALLETKSKAQ